VLHTVIRRYVLHSLAAPVQTLSTRHLSQCGSHVIPRTLPFDTKKLPFSTVNGLTKALMRQFKACQHNRRAYCGLLSAPSTSLHTHLSTYFMRPTTPFLCVLLLTAIAYGCPDRGGLLERRDDSQSQVHSTCHQISARNLQRFRGILSS